MLTIVGGTYFEFCQDPHYYQLYGSGLRAACALSNFKDKIKLISCVGEQDLTIAQLICNSFKIRSKYYTSKATVRFDYYHPLSIYKFTEEPYSIDISDVQAENILYYDMLETQVKIKSNYAVYDAQNEKSFRLTSSSVEHLAVILNLQAALNLSNITNKNDFKNIGKYILESENADLVVIKNGPKGAYLIEKKKLTFIPVFLTTSVWPIGSGDWKIR